MAKTNKKEPPPAPALDETAVLFAEERVGPYILKPWSLAQFMDLMPALLQMMDGFLRLGLTAANAKEFMQRPLAELMPALIPVIPEVIGVTLGLPAPEVAQIGVGLQAALGMKILFNEQNQVEIKNFLAGFFSGKGPAKETPSPSPAP